MPGPGPSGVAFMAGVLTCLCLCVACLASFYMAWNNKGDPTGEHWQTFLNGSYFLRYKTGDGASRTESVVVVKDPAAHAGTPTQALVVEPGTRVLLVDATGALTGPATYPTTVTHAGVVATFADFQADFAPLYVHPGRSRVA